MEQFNKFLIFSLLCILLGQASAYAQTTLRGKVIDGETGEDLIGAAVAIVGGSGGAITDYNGEFVLKVDALPVTLKFSYTGYTAQEIQVTAPDQRLTVRLQTGAILIEETVVKGQRIDDKQKAAPLTVENLDAIAIKETPAVSFYNGLGNLKGVDLTTASLGFTIINTRGFNSTSPVRSLQIIDGVDNQAPGLNFSLGNFLGASELDVNGVELVAGASGPFYGPNAFNGVISMKTKDPFIHKGLSASLKGGERELFEGAVRWADAIKGKSGRDFFAYKLNFFYFRAYDWVADNYDPVYGTQAGQYFSAAENPGRYDAVNRYGDEYSSRFDQTGNSAWDPFYGMQQYHRTGYQEESLVDYNTRNYKANATFQFRLDPTREFESPEIVLASSFGSGTTVYQGDNRFSLRNILFFQNRLEFRQKDKFFVRAYATNEDAGDSYDPYFTALRLQTLAKSDEAWASDYSNYWTQVGKFQNQMVATGYPQLVFDPMTGEATFDYAKATQWFQNNGNLLAQWHAETMKFANTKTADGTFAYFEPGTTDFKREFDRITSTKSGRAGGTRFFDKSALYHVHGEYRFTPAWASYIVVGGNSRWYRPNSEGTIFSDTIEYVRDGTGAIVDSAYRKITNSEFGLYTGIEKKVWNDRITLSATVRADKNQNFDLLFTPAASIVYNPNRNNFLRFSFSSAIRNPTLTDQYLFLNVGRAILVGNLNGFNNLITLESFLDGINGVLPDVTKFRYINVDPIQPEKVKTFELGYRTTLWNRLYMDAGYYYSIYNDFIGYNLGVDVPVSGTTVDIRKLQIYRVSANSTSRVTTQGFNIGLNFYFGDYYQLSGNYSWNKLNKVDENDPIIPAFNTPEHKFNIGFSARDLTMGPLKRTGFNVTYKWVQGFLFEGSPQFTGFIPTYDMVDAQWNVTFPKINTTFKIGAMNIFGIAPLFRDDNGGKSKLKAMFDNRQFQTYGGPRIGRMAYISAVYNFQKK